ncbi:hypothetical protein L1856_25385 [Streptomyces sp. Tue 6430]|nr:hypothetical protein [Streptomyces sp. Tue 6430]
MRGIDALEEVRERVTGCGDPEILRHCRRRVSTEQFSATVGGLEAVPAG